MLLIAIDPRETMCVPREQTVRVLSQQSNVFFIVDIPMCENQHVGWLIVTNY